MFYNATMMNFRTLLPLIPAALLLQACMSDQVLYDKRIPINERSEKYQEVLGAGQAARGSKESAPDTGALICAKDARFQFAWASAKPNGSAKENTCFIAGKVECETPGLKYRFGAVDWTVGSNQGAVAADENGSFFVPVKKTETNELIAVQVSDVRAVYQNGRALELKVSEKVCLKK